MARPGPNKAFRDGHRAISDGLGPEDTKWYLCRTTGRTYMELMALVAESRGSVLEFETVIGVKNIRRPNKYGDNGWWVTICAWVRMFLPQWEQRFWKTMEDLTTLPDPSAILAAASQALGIAPELLVHLAEHRQEIEIFLETQRGLLGTLAESKLWSLVAQGDAATIRWLLPRIRTEAYGDKLADVPGDRVHNVKIIEVTGSV